MKKEIALRDQIFAFRVTRDFIAKFDELCNQSGCCRSEVARLALESFIKAKTDITQ